MPPTTASVSEVSQEYTWETQPAAAKWLHQAIASLARRNTRIDLLARLLKRWTGTRLVDWIDHLSLASGGNGRLEADLAAAGFVALPLAAADATETSDGHPQQGQLWRHPKGMFPPVLVDAGRVGLAVRADSIDGGIGTLTSAMDLSPISREEVSGQPGGPFRQACLHLSDGVSLWMTERHGYAGFAPPAVEPAQIEAAARQLEAFRFRRRSFDRLEEGFAYTAELFHAAAEALGRSWACDLFFTAEREYWQSRNRAARAQYARQQRLGLGWANHDHHTYRSSRPGFAPLIAALEQMGFACRERFYAGREAGWGAQVLEHPECRIVIFADVDLSPSEVAGDFAHQPLAARDELGTVGLWCQLHGEAVFEAGLHHLECQFEFDTARRQLSNERVDTMAPFTDFPFLKQAFTCGEMWAVDHRRVDRLLASRQISAEQAARFRREGALGSHLEILERNDGYKGFNQTGISEIITRTDPRRQAIGA